MVVSQYGGAASAAACSYVCLVLALFVAKSGNQTYGWMFLLLALGFWFGA
jgi:hypothetical protein